MQPENPPQEQDSLELFIKATQSLNLVYRAMQQGHLEHGEVQSLKDLQKKSVADIEGAYPGGLEAALETQGLFYMKNPIFSRKIRTPEVVEASGGWNNPRTRAAQETDVPLEILGKIKEKFETTDKYGKKIKVYTVRTNERKFKGVEPLETGPKEISPAVMQYGDVYIIHLDQVEKQLKDKWFNVYANKDQFDNMKMNPEDITDVCMKKMYQAFTAKRLKDIDDVEAPEQIKAVIFVEACIRSVMNAYLKKMRQDNGKHAFPTSSSDSIVALSEFGELKQRADYIQNYQDREVQ